MKYFDWNREKNKRLKEERDISFEEVSEAIVDKKILDAFEHPNQTRYPNQKVFVLEIRDYAYFVAYIEDEEKIFLKTVYPDRDLTKKYLRK